VRVGAPHPKEIAMRIRLAASTVLALFLAGTAVRAQGSLEEIPTTIKRLPKVIPTADEIANPELYHPVFNPDYVMPAASALPAPPPAGVVRPGEFEPMDSVVITILGYGSAYYPMWRDMVAAFSGVTHTYIIIESDTLQNGMVDLFDSVGVPADSYTFLDYNVDAIWVRDYGPEITREEDGTRHITDFQYHPDRPNDDAIPGVIAEDDWINADGSPMALHDNDHKVNGGNIVTDGAGTCFFSNIIYGYEKPSGWSDDDVDQAFVDYLGCEQIITLQSICMDGTGHIDLYAKAMGRRSILLGEYPSDTHFNGENPSNMSYGFCDNYAYPNDYQDMEDNLATIEATTNLDGEPWVVTRLPMPEPYWDDSWGGFWVVRSYMNSQVVNGVVAMPSFYDEHPDGWTETADELLDLEAEAIAAYEASAPNGVEVFAIDSDHIIPLAGAIHCISHEIPAETDYEYTEPGDTDTDTDSDSDSDTDTEEEEDAGVDAGADTDTGGSTDDGCGCSSVGAASLESLLSALL
jgi:agmatine/peptidylarginine deiminase